MEKVFTSIRIPRFLHEFYLVHYRQDDYTTEPAENIGLKDGDLTNTVYDSERNEGFRYIYLRSKYVLLMNKVIHWWVYLRTGVKLFGGIGDHCAPLNIMAANTSLRAHRDRNFLAKQTPDYIAVMPLDSLHIGGEFYYNTWIGNDVSDNGKCFREIADRRETLKLQPGRIYILANKDTIHGVYRVERGERLTVTFRSK